MTQPAGHPNPNDAQRAHDPSRSDPQPPEKNGHPGTPEERDNASVVSTTDPVIAEETQTSADWDETPEETMTVETSGVREGRVPVFLNSPRPVLVREPDPVGPINQARDRDDEDDRNEPEDRPHSAGLWKSLLLTGGVALLCGVLGAWGYLEFFGPAQSGETGPSKQQKGSDSGQASSSSQKGQKSGGDESKKSGGDQAKSNTEIPGFTSAEDADTLEKQIDHLSERIDHLSSRLDRVSEPRNDPPPGLRTLQIKVGELAREVDEVANLPERVRRSDQNLEDLREQVRSLRDRISSSSTGSGSGSNGTTIPASSAPTILNSSPESPDSPTREPAVIDLNDPEAAIHQGIQLFQNRDYAVAHDVFRKLQAELPTDARVWYYSALAQGVTSGDWSDEARRFVLKGLDCERAGHPSSVAIDAAVGGLKTIEGRDWLAAYRSRLTQR